MRHLTIAAEEGRNNKIPKTQLKGEFSGDYLSKLSVIQCVKLAK
jgi:hypothetical protein